MFFHLRISLILAAAIVIVAARLVVSFPSHGTQKFLGHSYWNKRYPSLGYTEWDGFWNNYDSGRTVTNVAHRRLRWRFVEDVTVTKTNKN